MNELSPSQIQAIARSLRERRSELVQVGMETLDSRAAVELDQGSVGRLTRMDAIQRQEMALAAERRRGLEITRIDHALERIDRGDFGYCMRCGERIAVARLQADPTTPICIGCASS